MTSDVNNVEKERSQENFYLISIICKILRSMCDVYARASIIIMFVVIKYIERQIISYYDRHIFFERDLIFFSGKCYEIYIQHDYMKFLEEMCRVFHREFLGIFLREFCVISNCPSFLSDSQLARPDHNCNVSR